MTTIEAKKKLNKLFGWRYKLNSDKIISNESDFSFNLYNFIERVEIDGYHESETETLEDHQNAIW